MTQNDVREAKKSTRGIFKTKRCTEFVIGNGYSRQKMQEFISASIYAMEKINFAENQLY